MLVPLYLGSLYARLYECLRSIFKSVDQYDIVTYADASFLQMFLWERFLSTSPMPVEFKAMKPDKIIVDGVEMKKSSHYKP